MIKESLSENVTPEQILAGSQGSVREKSLQAGTSEKAEVGSDLWQRTARRQHGRQSKGEREEKQLGAGVMIKQIRQGFWFYSDRYKAFGFEKEEGKT